MNMCQSVHDDCSKLCVVANLKEAVIIQQISLLG